MTKQMKELRNKLAYGYASLEEYPNTVWRNQGFKDGFSACYAEMAPLIEILEKELMRCSIDLKHLGEKNIAAKVDYVLSSYRKKIGIE